MGKIKFDETYIFNIRLTFDVTIGIKISLSKFSLLLSRVALYYSSLPRTVWYETLVFGNEYLKWGL